MGKRDTTKLYVQVLSLSSNTKEILKNQGNISKSLSKENRKYSKNYQQ